MNNSYTVRLVHELDDETPHKSHPQGGFGLAKDDIIYQAVRDKLDNERPVRSSDEELSSDID